MGARPPGSDDAAAEREAESAEEESRAGLWCRACREWVADPDDAVSIHGEPTVRSFVNPHGFVHDVLTLSHAAGMLHGGPRVGADSWFPGYVWQIGVCGGCGAHLGWRYTAVSGAVPSTFVGLRRAAVVESLE